MLYMCSFVDVFSRGLFLFLGKEGIGKVRC